MIILFCFFVFGQSAHAVFPLPDKNGPVEVAPEIDKEKESAFVRKETGFSSATQTRGFTEQVRKSSVIFDGWLESTEAFTNENSRLVYTRYRFRVIEWVSDKTHQEDITVTALGGVLPDGIGMTTGRSVRLSPGQRYVVMLDEDISAQQSFKRVFQVADQGESIADEFGYRVSSLKGNRIQTETTARMPALSYFPPNMNSPVEVLPDDAAETSSATKSAGSGSSPDLEHFLDFISSAMEVDRTPVAANISSGARIQAAQVQAGNSQLCGWTDGALGFDFLVEDDEKWDWVLDGISNWNTLVADHPNGDGYLIGTYSSPSSRDVRPTAGDNRNGMGILDDDQMVAGGYGAWEGAALGETFIWFSNGVECASITETDVLINPAASAHRDIFRMVATHQQGHALGLGHERGHYSIMWPGVTTSQIESGASTNIEQSQQMRTLATQVVKPSLKQAAISKGNVRVIVGLNLNTTPQGLLSDTSARSQQSSISTVQGRLMATLAGLRAKENSRFRYIPFIVMTVDVRALEALENSPLVRSVNLDESVSSTLDNTNPGIGSPNAWSHGLTGAGWTVAVIDTGVDKSHPWFSTYNKVVSEACYSTTMEGRTRSLCPGGATSSTEAGSGLHCDASIDGCDHGTHVAGIAVGNDGVSDLRGVAPDANLIAIQAASEYYLDDDCTVSAPCAKYFMSDVTRALERVFELRNSHDIAAVNLSLGGGQFFDSASCEAAYPSWTAAIDNLRSVGIAAVSSSGNSGYRDSVGSPACISSVVSVGNSWGSGYKNIRESSNTYPELSLLAPGTFVDSSVPGGGVDQKSGTSMAAPHVAGAWALLKEAQPLASVGHVLADLQVTGDPVDDNRSGGTVTGIPRIQVDLALTHQLYWPPNYGSSWYGRANDMSTMRTKLVFANSVFPNTWVLEEWTDMATWSQTNSAESPYLFGAQKMTAFLGTDGSSDHIIYRGTPVSLEGLHVENRGNLLASNVYLKFYLSENTAISDTDIPVGQVYWSTFSAQGFWANGTRELSIPVDIAKGEYYVGWILTTDEEERSTANNKSTLRMNQQQFHFNQKLVILGNPDLRALKPFTFGTEKVVSTNFDILVSVVNEGDELANGPFLNVYLSSDSTIRPTDDLLLKSFFPDIEAGPEGLQQRTLQIMAPDELGTYYIGFCVDFVAGEPTTDNNCSPGARIEVTGRPNGVFANGFE